jgi:hypothetical protein
MLGLHLLCRSCIEGQNSSYRENAEHLSRRLELWDQGNFRELAREGQTCQDRLRAGSACSSDDSLARRFATKVFNGSFKGAMSLLSDKGKGGVLPLNARTTKEMQAKHPKPAEPLPESLITGDMPPDTHEVLFTALDGELIRKCALQASGSAGVSQQEDKLHQMVICAHL